MDVTFVEIKSYSQLYLQGKTIPEDNDQDQFVLDITLPSSPPENDHSPLPQNSEDDPLPPPQNPKNDPS